MQKITSEFVKHTYTGKSIVKEYATASTKIKLWGSEKIVFEKYLKKEDVILDVGCGTGRTTFGLYRLGYKNIIGLDLSETMLEEAISLNEERKWGIEFVVGDATKLQYEEGIFDSLIFSFNGLMQIPWHENRMKALKEIYRVLKKDGIFIFTTHDRDEDRKHLYYWKEEKTLWEKGKQDARLLEFGDLIYKSGDRVMYIHVPSRLEMLQALQETGFEVIEDKYRTEIYSETDDVKEFADECRFWIVKK